MKLLIPIAAEITAELDIPVPMTSAEWTQMMTVLEAMRPGIVRESETQEGYRAVLDAGQDGTERSE